MDHKVKPLKYKKLPFLSEAQLTAHHDVLYAGYVKKKYEIEGSLLNLNRAVGNATYNEYRELKIEGSFAENGVNLHEWYFDNMGGDGKPTDAILKKIEKSFKTFEDFKLELIEAGLSARGWVVLAEDGEDRLSLKLCDAHNQNGIWGANPILVLDVYEHAYFIDYGTNRKEYIERFIENINWNVVESRLK